MQYVLTAHLQLTGSADEKPVSPLSKFPFTTKLFLPQGSHFETVGHFTVTGIQMIFLARYTR